MYYILYVFIPYNNYIGCSTPLQERSHFGLMMTSSIIKQYDHNTCSTASDDINNWLVEKGLLSRIIMIPA